jgi:hypothetical protein
MAGHLYRTVAAFFRAQFEQLELRSAAVCLAARRVASRSA